MFLDLCGRLVSYPSHHLLRGANIPKSFHLSGKTYHWVLWEKYMILCLNLIHLWFHGKCNFPLTRSKIKVALVGYGVGRKRKEDETNPQSFQPYKHKIYNGNSNSNSPTFPHTRLLNTNKPTLSSETFKHFV